MTPEQVASRLAVLRRLYTPEPLDQARQRLELERPRVAASFAERAARSLSDLRALDELSRYLRPRGGSPPR